MKITEQNISGLERHLAKLPTMQQAVYDELGTCEVLQRLHHNHMAMAEELGQMRIVMDRLKQESKEEKPLRIIAWLRKKGVSL